LHIKNDNPAYGAELEAFAGIPTFMRQPASRNLKGIDVAVVGIPFDGGAASFRSGARMGPRKIRECSLAIWGYNRILEVAPLDVLKLVDYGDIAVQPPNIETTIGIIAREAQPIINAGIKMISLGGDHSISYPLLKAHAARYGPLALVHFDSHCDTEGGYRNHGTPFADAFKAGLIDAGAYIKVGIRGPIFYADELKNAEHQGARIFTVERCFEEGIKAIIEHIHDIIADKRVYVSLDIDVVDPAYAPGTGTPEVGGFTSYQILQLVRGLQGLDAVGFDLVEVSPAYDSPGEITSILAANLAFEFLSLLALNKLGSENAQRREHGA
jgi:agmatinase/guanidinopropionase